MNAPDDSAISFQTGSDFSELLRINTEESILKYMGILGQRLKAKDDRWGYLTKTPGEKHLTLPNGQFISVDSFCWKDTQQVFDCIGNAVEPDPASPSWGEKPRRPENIWYPIGEVVTPPSNGDDTAIHIHLQNQINELQRQIDEIKQNGTSLDGKKIALLAEANNRWVCADKEKGPDVPLMANRDSPGPWETFIIKQK